ncbi:Tyrosine-protein phosphatase [Tolypocladium ophioglossoides CBS 100239]|uniref:Tyrosine-protein phosphatase n=1 Tax=Tolypocladium ophioglossoides (strain CBS 100239) TaxID=1163406 RepID=A0A0L0N6I5_TOLOC|nr:Tyrosine-protein phosphatase [Tolypocladium ophioglossoides CBS 100239]
MPHRRRIQRQMLETPLRFHPAMTLSTAELDALAATDVREALAPDVLLPVLASPPFIPTRSLFNFRDAGAVPGSALAAGRFYRSGVLEGAAREPEALAWMAAHVRRIFDLRLANERERAPDPALPGVENVWLEGQESYPTPDVKEFAVDGGVPAWRRQYVGVTLSYRPVIRALLEHVRDRPTEPVLFHCTAGRDRTGVVAGLLHHLAGTPPQDAARDYMLSRIGTEPARDMLVQFAMASTGVTDPETPGFVNLVSLRPEFWEGFLEGLDDEFGGWDGYVTKGLGFSEGDLAKIKENLRS